MDDVTQTLQGLSALAHETRLLAFRALIEAAPSGLAAGAISERLGIAPSKLSPHLAILSAAGLVSAERHGRHLVYHARIDRVSALIASIVDTCCNGHPEVCGALTGLQPKQDCC